MFEKEWTYKILVKVTINISTYILNMAEHHDTRKSLSINIIAGTEFESEMTL